MCLLTGPVYAIDWCKTSAPGQQLRPRSAFRIALSSFTEDFRNRIAIAGLRDERVLIEEDYIDYPDFDTLVDAHHGYPATALQWQPASAAKVGWSAELLATAGDSLRIWEYADDSASAVQASGYVNVKQPAGGHRLTLKSTLAGVRSLFYFI